MPFVLFISLIVGLANLFWGLGLLTNANAYGFINVVIGIIILFQLVMLSKENQ